MFWTRILIVSLVHSASCCFSCNNCFQLSGRDVENWAFSQWTRQIKLTWNRFLKCTRLVGRSNEKWQKWKWLSKCAQLLDSTKHWSTDCFRRRSQIDRTQSTRTHQRLSHQLKILAENWFAWTWNYCRWPKSNSEWLPAMMWKIR